jgi:hypothetical protein
MQLKQLAVMLHKLTFVPGDHQERVPSRWWVGVRGVMGLRKRAGSGSCLRRTTSVDWTASLMKELPETQSRRGNADGYVHNGLGSLLELQGTLSACLHLLNNLAGNKRRTLSSQGGLLNRMFGGGKNPSETSSTSDATTTQRQGYGCKLGRIVLLGKSLLSSCHNVRRALTSDSDIN